MKDIEKLEEKKFGTEIVLNGVQIRTMTGAEGELETIIIKINEIIDYINSKKDQLL